jgi:hypothetical protein
VRCVAALVDAETARARLLTGRVRTSVRRSARRNDPALAGTRLPHLELLWLPFLFAEAAPSVTAAPDARRPACVVCASTGLASRLELGAQSFAEPQPVTAPAIAHETLIGLAHAHLGRVARLAGADAAEEIACEDWAFPFWLLHYERTAGRLDFAVLDAVTGHRVGGSVRQALLHAITTGQGSMA